MPIRREILGNFLKIDDNFLTFICVSRTYNLRSGPKDTDTVSETERLQQNDSKISPKKQYPQLQINTQKSPKMMAARQSRVAYAKEVTPSKVPEIVDLTETTTDVVDIEDLLADETRKSESKRIYPQLGVNVRRSPTVPAKNENSSSSSSIGLKKRKINFETSETSSSNSEMFDVSSITAQWKKRRLKTRKNPNFNGPGSKENSDYYRTHDEVRRLLRNVVVDPFDDVLGNDDDPRNTTYTIASDISSQKYSLKINLDSAGPEAKLLIDQMRFKVPVVRLTRISEENLRLSDPSKFTKISEENPNGCNVVNSFVNKSVVRLTRISEEYLKTLGSRAQRLVTNDVKADDDKIFEEENLAEPFSICADADPEDLKKESASCEREEEISSKFATASTSSRDINHRRKNMGRAIGKCKIINICKSAEKEIHPRNSAHVEDILDACRRTDSNIPENDRATISERKIDEIPEKKSLKRRKLGIRMGVKNKSCESTLQSNPELNPATTPTKSETNARSDEVPRLPSSETPICRNAPTPSLSDTSNKSVTNAGKSNKISRILPSDAPISELNSPFNLSATSIKSEISSGSIGADVPRSLPPEALISNDDIKEENDLFHERDVNISDFEIKSEQFSKNCSSDFKVEKPAKIAIFDRNFENERKSESEKSNSPLRLGDESKKCFSLREEAEYSLKNEFIFSSEMSSKASSGIADTVICSPGYDPEMDMQLLNEYEYENTESNLSKSGSHLRSVFYEPAANQIGDAEARNYSDIAENLEKTLDNDVLTHRDTIIYSNFAGNRSQEILKTFPDPANRDTCSDVAKTQSQEILKTLDDPANMDTVICSNLVDSQNQDVLKTVNDPANMDTIIYSSFTVNESQNKFEDDPRSPTIPPDSNIEPTQRRSQIRSPSLHLPSGSNCEMWKHNEKTVVFSGNSEEELSSLELKETQNTNAVKELDEDHKTDAPARNSSEVDFEPNNRSNIPQSQTDSSDSFICSLNSEDDFIFSELNLPSFVMSQSNSAQNPSPKKSEPNPSEINSGEPGELLHQVSINQNQKSEIPTCTAPPKKVISSIPDTVICDNSMWDPVEMEKSEDQIQSFYLDESLMCPETTLFRSEKSPIVVKVSVSQRQNLGDRVNDKKSSPILKLTPETNKISERVNSGQEVSPVLKLSADSYEPKNDEKSSQEVSPVLKLSADSFEPKNDEKSSPIFGVLTPKRNDDEILSFYDVESPACSVISPSDDKLSDVESDPCLQNKTSSTEDQNSSPVSTVIGALSPVMLHSTPQHGKSKKSPSPTYTPILKKLMLKKMRSGKRSMRRRISSQRFQSEPFLENIVEDEEAKFKKDKSPVSI